MQLFLICSLILFTFPHFPHFLHFFGVFAKKNRIANISIPSNQHEIGNFPITFSLFCPFPPQIQFAFSVCLIFIYTSYAASIIALLQSTSDSIRTLADLLHSDIELGVEDIAYARPYFRNEDEPIRRQITRKKIEPPNHPARYYNMSYGVQRMQNEFFAFHTEMGIGYKHIQHTFLEHEKCALKSIEYFRMGYPLITMPKNMPYKEMMKVK